MLFFLFLLGLFVGSFLNVLIDRLPREETVLKGRSHCESCKHKLVWYDLIPLLSFVMLNGRCRYCKTSLSLYYPLVELTTGLLFALAFMLLQQGNVFLIAYHLLLISSLIVIFFIDLKFGIIPDKVLFPAILASLIFNFQFSTPIQSGSIFNYLLSALGAFTFFLLLFLGTKGKGMGFGDVKYVILMGLVLGFPNIVVGLYIAFLTGAVISLILVAWGKKKLRGSTIPFGPFLVLGTIVALFFGEYLLSQLSILNFQF